MKTIDILKNEWIESGTVSELGNPYLIYNRKDIKEAINELEELNNRSCKICEHHENNYCWLHDCSCRNFEYLCGKWEEMT